MGIETLRGSIRQVKIYHGTNADVTIITIAVTPDGIATHSLGVVLDDVIKAAPEVLGPARGRHHQ
jgi:hypothetical protein